MSVMSYQPTVNKKKATKIGNKKLTTTKQIIGGNDTPMPNVSNTHVIANDKQQNNTSCAKFEGKEYTLYNDYVRKFWSNGKYDVLISDDDEIEKLNFEQLLSLDNNSLQTYLDKFGISTKNGKLSNEKDIDIFQCLVRYVASSTLINNSLLEFFATGLPLYDKNSLNCTKNILESCIDLKEDLTVFHGSIRFLHVGGAKSFCCDAFLSTSLTPNVSAKFGDKIYKIQLPKGLKVIIPLNDMGELEIILPIGTIIEGIQEPYVFQGVTFYEATIMNTDEENNKRVQQIQYILESQCDGSPNVERVPKTFVIAGKEGDVEMQGSKEVLHIVGNDGNYEIKRPTVPEAFKPVPDEYQIRRMINEYVTLQIYKFYEVDTLDYFFIDYENANYLACKMDETMNYEWTEEFVNGVCDNFIIDCVLGNQNICTYGNIGMTSEPFGSGNVVRTSVDGSLAYNTQGHVNKDFFINPNPSDHKSILASNANIRIAFTLYGDMTVKLYKVLENADKKLKDNDLYVHILNKFTTDGYKPSDHLSNFVRRLVSRVITRHEYYLMNKQRIINEIHNQLNIVIKQEGGMNENSQTNTQNITYNDNKGIGGYTKEQFVQALNTMSEMSVISCKRNANIGGKASRNSIKKKRS